MDRRLFFECLFWGMLISAVTSALDAQSLPPVTVYGLKGPSGVGMIQLFENPPQYPEAAITVEALAQPDLMAARFISGSAKVGILPPNMAAKLAGAGARIQIAAVLGTGMLSLLTSDPDVRRIEDLRGKTLSAAGQGATPEYVFRRILRSKGINPDRDLRINFSLAYPEIARSLISGRIDTALIPEPFATMARAGKPDLREAADIQQEWVRAGGRGNYPMTALVVDAGFAASQPLMLKTILQGFKDSAAWVTANPDKAGVLVEKHGLGIRAQIARAAIPRSNYVFIPALEARASLEALYQAFLEFSPAAIGGRLPGDGFYLNPAP